MAKHRMPTSTLNNSADLSTEKNYARPLVQPFTPEQARANRQIPEAMISAVNELLTKYFDGKSAKISQKEIVEVFLANVDSKEWNTARIDKERILDFEPIYERKGWRVSYEKPGYNESGEAYFTFTAKTASSR